MCQALSQTPHLALRFHKATAKGGIVLLCEGSSELISHNLAWEHQQKNLEDFKRKQDKGQSAKVM